MSGYLSHFLGYVFQIFKKENSRKKNPTFGNLARKCNSVIEDRELKMKTEKITADLATPKYSLKRVNSCPQIKEDHTVHTKDGPRCRTCSDKLINLDSTQDTALSETNQDSKQNKSEDILTADSWNSVCYVGPLKISNNSSILRRFRSLDFQSNDNFFQNAKTHSRSTCLSDMGAGDGKCTESKKLEKSKLNLIQEVKNQSGFEITRVEQIYQKDFIPESSTNKDPPRTELEASDGKRWNGETLQESCYFDVPTDIQKEIKKEGFGEQKAHSETRDEPIPEYQYFEHLASSEHANKELCQQEYYYDVEEEEVYATPFQERRLSCKSKIPVHQRARRFSEGGKFTNYFQSGWRRSSRTNLCNWTLKNCTYKGRARRCHTKHTTSSITTAYRHQLNSKLDRMFREFSKNIYRGNIMDHSSHSRWMKLAGILEEEDASSFKSYAKCKVVLTLSEYKEALLKMCEDHHLDYWDVLKKMTEVKKGKAFCYGEKDEESIENIYKE